MPMKAAQLAALVERARQKPPSVIASQSPAPGPAQRATRPRQTAAATPPLEPASTPRPAPRQRMVPPAKTGPASPVPAPSPPPNETPTAQPSASDQTDDFPVGWQLSKESWHFHRRFYRIFRRPMHRGEYSHLLWQIRHRRAEHLWEDCWRVTLPNGKGSLMVRATRWYLITILPKHWQPPVRLAEVDDVVVPVSA